MKQYFLLLLASTAIIVACNNKDETKTSPASTSGNLKLPYTAGYTTDFSDNVSDEDLLLVLNSYKYWETADLKALRGTMGDSMVVDGATGFKFRGLTDSLMPKWTLSRDSLSSVVITMDAWRKNHTNKDSMNYITTWYKEIDTYKTGRVDSANYADINQVKKGKIIWYSSFKQKL
ncbi:MAG: hypothetical protein Q8941_08535 [Bacteroidota bacterium]|nr:hypothetical protein [Bacteroidota bacterium]